MRPLNSYSWRLGSSASRIPSMRARSVSEVYLAEAGRLDLIFRLVSPSRLAVST